MIATGSRPQGWYWSGLAIALLSASYLFVINSFSTIVLGAIFAVCMLAFLEHLKASVAERAAGK